LDVLGMAVVVRLAAQDTRIEDAKHGIAGPSATAPNAEMRKAIDILEQKVYNSLHESRSSRAVWGL